MSNDYLDFNNTSKVLSESAGRAFSSLVVTLYRKVTLIMYSSYSSVYNSKIVPIMDYSSKTLSEV